MAHADARTTVHGRQLIVDRYQAGCPQAHIADLRRELENAQDDVQHRVGEIYRELAHMCALDGAGHTSEPADRQHG